MNNSSNRSHLGAKSSLIQTKISSHTSLYFTVALIKKYWLYVCSGQIATLVHSPSKMLFLGCGIPQPSLIEGSVQAFLVPNYKSNTAFRTLWLLFHLKCHNLVGAYLKHAVEGILDRRRDVRSRTSSSSSSFSLLKSHHPTRCFPLSEGIMTRQWYFYVAWLARFSASAQTLLTFNTIPRKWSRTWAKSPTFFGFLYPNKRELEDLLHG